MDIWYDYNGYTLDPHRDDNRIKLALKIYLGDGDNAGTSLFENKNNLALVTNGEVYKNYNIILHRKIPKKITIPMKWLFIKALK